MRKRVLSLTMAFLLAFSMLPVQAAEDLPEQEKVAVEELCGDEKALVAEVPEDENPVVESESTPENALETEPSDVEAQTVKSTEAAKAESTTKAADAKATTKSADAEESTQTAQETTSQTEESKSDTKNANTQETEQNVIAVQTDGDATEAGETETQEKTVKVGETEYTSFAEAMEAVNAASGNVTMTILADIENTDAETGTFSYTNADAALTIDLNGKTVHVSKFTVDSGTVTFQDTNPAEENYFSKVTVNASGKAVLESGCLGTENWQTDTVDIYGTFEMSGGRVAGELYPHRGANVSITDGYVRKLFVDSPKDKVTIILSGGEFGSFTKDYGQDVSYAALLKAGYGYKTDGNWLRYKSIDDTSPRYNLKVEKCEQHVFRTEGVCENCNYQCPHTNMTQDTDTCPDCGMSWMIKSEKDGAVTRYGSLDDAFANSPDGSTLTLMKDTSDHAAHKITDKEYTLDLDGHTLESWNINIRRTTSAKKTSLTLTGSGKLKAMVNVSGVTDLKLPETWTGSITEVFILSGSHDQTRIEGGTIDRLTLYVSKLSISGGTFGRIYNNLDRNSNIPVRALLESGYVFKQGNQAIEYSKEFAPQESLWGVTVEPCTEHRDKDGDQLCDYCNQSATYTVEMTDADGNTAQYSGLQGALNEAQDGAKVKLLADIPAGAQNAAYTADKKQLTLDLNGKTISGDGISAINGADLTVTGDGTVTGTVKFDGTSKGTLEKGKFGKVESENPDQTLLELLAEGYAYRSYSDNTWLTDATAMSVDSVEVLQAPVQQLNITNSIGELTYGYSTDAQQYIQVNATLQAAYPENAATYQWYKVEEDGTETKAEGATNAMFYIPEGLEAGTYTYRVYVTCDDYTSKVETAIEVAKADSTVTTAPVAKELTYNGLDQQLVTAGSTSNGTVVYGLEKDGTYTTEIPTGNAVQEYNVWYKVKGDSNHNDSEPKSVTAKISYLTTDAVATLDERNKGENGWYTGAVRIQAPEGFLISSELAGPYAGFIPTYTNGENTYYLRRNDDGCITDAKVIPVKIDMEAPTRPTLTITKEATDTTVTLQATAEDETSGVKEYTLSETSGKIPPQTSSDGVFALTGLDSDEEYNFTVTATDQAGNVSSRSEICKVKTRKIPFADAEVKLKNTDKIYNGTAQTPDVEVSVNGTVLSLDQYVVSYEQDGAKVDAPTKAGTYTLVVAASENGDYEGTASGQLTYTIAKKTITAKLDGTMEKIYDGTTDVPEAQKLSVVLTGVEDGDEVAASAEAYVYNDANVKDADTITGSGLALAGADAENYQLAETKISANAKILPKDLSEAEVTLGAALTANGKTQTQEVEKVTLEGTVLTDDDYEITGNQAAAAGSYVLTVAGKNNYTGKVEKTYVVQEKKQTIDPSTSDKNSSGSDKNPSDGSGKGKTTSTSSGSRQAKSKKVKTGDAAPVEWMIVLAAFSAAGIGLMFARKRKR